MKHVDSALEKFPTSHYIFSNDRNIEQIENFIDNRYKEPTFIYFKNIIKNKVDKIRQSINHQQLLYSLKANPNPIIAKYLNTKDVGIEVASPGELDSMIKAGIPPNKIHYSCPGKSDHEIVSVLKKDIGVFVIDSIREIDIINKHLSKTSCTSTIGLRINLSESFVGGVEKMSGGSSQFGIDDNLALEYFSSRVSTNFHINHLHMYAASQVLQADDIISHMRNAISFAGNFRKLTGHPVELINVGGGYGVPNVSSENTLDMTTFSKMNSEIESAKNNGFSILLESGRFIVAESGLYMSRVVDIKSSCGKKQIILDGGMHHFLRSAFMKVEHPIICFTKLNAPETDHYRICGRLCTPLDCFSPNIYLPKLQTGDFIAVLNAGAYGRSMSPSHFLSHSPAQEIFF